MYIFKFLEKSRVNSSKTKLKKNNSNNFEYQESMNNRYNNQIDSRQKIEMKKQIIPQKRQVCSAQKKKFRTQNISRQKNALVLKQSKESQLGSHLSERKYQNRNLSEIPPPLLICLSSLTSVDISYNQLNDSQIELLMNNCTKLNTLCINGNRNELIPAAIWKLKDLQYFKHDWLRVCNENIINFQLEQNLKKLQLTVQKPAMVVKINRVVGINFQLYCQQLATINLDDRLVQKIKKSNCTEYAKQLMLKTIKDRKNTTRLWQTLKIKPIIQKQQLLVTCRSMCGFDQTIKKKQARMSVLHKQQSININVINDQNLTQTDCGSHKIKIQNIRHITEIQSSISINQHEISYQAPGYPLHELFANFNNNKTIPIQIDKLLLAGYNPNQYDTKGLSPYHVCVIKNQKKGLEHLISISLKNPGFFDLEMPSKNEGRTMLHCCVFLKNYYFTKQLIEFGFPLQKRDSNGARIIHLVDQNYEFILLLRKIIKKFNLSKNNNNRVNRHLVGKKYQQHPQRVIQQSKFRIVEKRNDKLMEMFQAVVSLGRINRIK